MVSPDAPSYVLAYTTARPALIGTVLERWFGRAAAPDGVTAVLCVDEPDAAEAEAALAAGRWSGRTRFVVNRGARTCVAGWNEAARHADGDVILAVADDFDPPARWDEALTASAPARWWREDRVVAVGDGNCPDVFTLGILTRRRLERFGYLFHPAYESLFCDTEFTAVACGEGAVIDARRLVFEHLHYDLRKRAQDDVDRRHASKARWDRGEALFLARQRAGFPPAASAGVSVPPAEPELRFALVVQATRDDFCLRETVDAVLRQQRPGREAVGAVFFFCPDEYWSGRPTPAAETAEVGAVAARLRAEWPGVAFRVERQTVAPWRTAAGSRVEVETRARNAALRAVRAAGYAHALIADGDELWRSGLLADLAGVVRAQQPGAVVARMVPVAGLPGYPIEGAKDRATIYVGPGAWFVVCRSVCGPVVRMEARKILHFTATRRTLAEIELKHRESGHYDDPDYDFEGWIKDVLPRIRPGLERAHMYRPMQIWPRVRGWTRAERAEIPPSLHRYLGTERESVWRTWFGLRRRD